MPITVICKNCESSLRVPEEMAGRTGKCKKCGATITVPTASKAEEPVQKTTPEVKTAAPTPSGNRLVPLSKRGKFNESVPSTEEARVARDRRKESREEEVIEDYEEVEEVEETQSKPKKKKKKKQAQSSEKSLLAKIAGGVGAVFVFIVVFALKSGLLDSKPDNTPKTSFQPPQFANIAPPVPPTSFPQGNPFPSGNNTKPIMPGNSNPASQPTPTPTVGAQDVTISNARWENGIGGRAIAIDYKLSGPGASTIGCTLIIKGSDGKIITSSLTGGGFGQQSGTWNIRIIGPGGSSIGACEIWVERGGFYSTFNQRPGTKISNSISGNL
jgi:hypothetical protein